MGAARRRRLQEGRQPAARRRRGGARGPPRRDRGAVGRRSRGRVDRRAGRPASKDGSALRSATRRMRVLQPARLVRRLAAKAADAGVEIVEGRRVMDRAELEAETVVIATDGYPSGLLGELEGLIVPTRGQVIATEPLAERLFDVPHYGRHGFDYWHQTDGRPDRRRRLPRCLARPRVHGRGEADRRRPARALDVRERARRARAPRRLPLGGHLRPRPRLPSRRRPGPRPAGHVGGGRILGTRERARASPAAAWSLARSSAIAIRCSTCSSLGVCSAEPSKHPDFALG